ncbi:MAG: delta-60 repeat domain-containing protein, partial [Flavobacteriales bacterium]
MTKYLFPAFLLFVACSVRAQEGALDPTFNSGDVGFGVGTGIVGSGSATVRCIAVQPDGRSIVGGEFYTYNNTSRNDIARLNVDGTLDPSFDPGTGVGGISGSLLAMALQPDGKVVICGTFSSYNGTALNRIARVNSNGTLDNLFTVGTGADGSVSAIALQPDGKILIGGTFTTFNGTPRSRIARLNADGTLDATFDPGTGASATVFAIALQPDGTVLIGGSFTTYNGTMRNRIARVNANGTLDASFDPSSGIPVGAVSAIVVQPDGKLMIGGSFSNYSGSSRNAIARINATGSLDASFDPGTGFYSNAASRSVFSLTLQADGNVVAAGEFNSYNGTSCNGIARLTTTGALDASFAIGTGANAQVLAAQLRPDGSLMVGGAFTNFSTRGCGHVAHVSASGQPDSAFNTGTGVSGPVGTMELQPDGKIIIGGIFHSYNNTRRNNLARLHADGTLDTSFDPGSGPNGEVMDIALQPDGKVIIVGGFTSVNGTVRNRIARLNTDGSLDLTFDPGNGASSTIHAVALRPDGKMVIVGDFTSYNTTGYEYIARVNANGSLDFTFTPGGLPNASVYAIGLQADGKILIAGWFDHYGIVPRNRLARLQVDGQLDTSFDPGSGTGHVFEIIFQPDGKALLCGEMVVYNGSPVYRVLRLNTNGTLDNSFAVGTGPNTIAYSMALQPDGKVLIGGAFSTVNGTPRNRLARLNANGSLDSSFDPGAGPNAETMAIGLQADGQVLIGGHFTAYAGVGRNRIARLDGAARVGIRVMLEGPYSGGQMNDALRTLPSFPLTEPFTAMGYAETGYVPGATIPASLLSVTGNNAIVDWVLVEMRPVATPGTVAATRAALLQRDGDVVDLDGASTVGFAGLPAGSYCVAVKPRTHLPVMLSTSAPVLYGDGIATVDFTLPGTQVYDTDALNNNGGVMLLATGDAVFNENLQYTG